MMENTLYQNLKVQAEWNPTRTTLTLKIPTKRPDWLVPPISWVVRPPAYRSLVLDPVGADLWTWCDGSRTVEKVVEMFADKHSLTFHEARVSATSYLKELVRRGALAVAI
ncbi:MAG: PqqD family protein [Kiritimatiellia bacterium]